MGKASSGGHRPRSRLLHAALFLTLGLVAAFAVSAIAGLRTAAPEPDGGPVPATLGRDDEAAGEPGGEPVRIEVLNGAGRAGLARVATAQLRSDGFDVVFFGNAARFDHARSVVLDRTGDPDRAAAVARALGIDSVATAIDAGLLLDVSVVLGADWPPPPPPGAGPLDRIRQFLVPDDGDAP